MNWIKRIFNWKKAPKATNEMKPVEMGKHLFARSPSHFVEILTLFIGAEYWKVKKSWKRSPKHYSLYYNLGDPYQIKIVKNNSICKKYFQDKNNVVVGNLYTLYQQYYGKETKY